MAGPFEIFRQNQKVWVAVLGILCIFAFTLSDAMMSAGAPDPGSRGQNAVVAETRFGPIRESDLGFMMMQRRMVFSFLVQAKLAQLGPRSSFMAPYVEQQVANEFPLSEESVVLTYVMARLGQEMGLRAPDEAIDSFLRMWTADMVSGEQYAEILRGIRVSEQRTANKAMLYDALRRELLATQTRQVILTDTDTPAERWDLYRRVHRRVTGKAVAVPVSDFVDKTDKPSEATLREFFQKHQDKIPTPGSPEPGFRVPDKAAFRYFVAHYEDFLAKVEVTDEEIREHYDQFKSTRYVKPWSDFGLDQPATGTSSTEPESDEPASEAETSDSPQDAAAEPADEPPAAPESSDTESVDSEPADQPPTEQPADETSEPETTDDNTNDQSNIRTGGASLALGLSPASLISVLQADDGANAAAEQPATAQAAGGEAPAEEKPVYEPIGDDMMLRSSIAAPPGPPVGPVEYRPLEEVRDQIRNEIAGPKAREKMQQALDKVRRAVSDYASKRALWEIHRSDPKNTTPEPTPIDADALAQENGLTTGATPLVSAFEARQIPGLGESTNGSIPFVQIAFGQLDLFIPARTTGINGDEFLFWKTEQKEAHTPPFADVKDEVERVWRMIQARELALAEARRIADEARQTNNLSDVAGDRQVIEIGPFTWMRMSTAGATAGMPQAELSEVPGIEDPGDDFMRMATRLNQLEIGVAFNNPQTIAYVVQVTTVNPVETVQREFFMTDPPERYLGANRRELEELQRAFRDKIIARSGLKWLRDPDQRQDF